MRDTELLRQKENDKIKDTTQRQNTNAPHHVIYRDQTCRLITVVVEGQAIVKQ